MWVLVHHESATLSAVDAIVILVVSCPCAISLAVCFTFAIPLFLFLLVFTSYFCCSVITYCYVGCYLVGICEGVLFCSAEVLHDIDVIAFDKTGTLTQGNFTVECAEILIKGAEQIVQALVKDNKDLISQGVYCYLSAHLSSTMEHCGGAVTDIVSFPGKEIKASICASGKHDVA